MAFPGHAGRRWPLARWRSLTRTAEAIDDDGDALRGVTKRFGDTVAVDRVDLDLADGELLALVGPSGCGKSTLLRVVAGLVGADEGEVRLGDAVVDDGSTSVDPERRHVGLVFQEHALFPHLTVGQNVAFGLRSGSRRERDAVRDEWLERVGLGAHGSRYPHELSGGERQRVALARALAPAPRLMLLDEPFASLDPNLRAQIRADVVEILRATATPAVFVTHDQGEAMAVGDRVAVMRRRAHRAARLARRRVPRPEQPVRGRVHGRRRLPADHGQRRRARRRSWGPSTCRAAPARRRWRWPGPTTSRSRRRRTARPRSSAPSSGAPRGATRCASAPAPLVQSSRSHLVRAERGTRVRVSLVAGHRLVAVEGDEPAPA